MIEALSASAPETPERRLAGLALAISGTRRRRRAQFAAVAVDTERVGGDEPVPVPIQGQLDNDVDARRLAELAAGVPIITDAPRPTLAALDQVGVRSAGVWDVLELASLLVPECPAGSLERVAGFFGLSAAGEAGLNGLAATARLIVELFSVLLGLLEQVDTPTLLHASRLAAPTDWPLRGLVQALERQRVASPLETGALAGATPIGGWITRGAAGRQRTPLEADPHPPPLDAAEIAASFGPDGGLARALPGYEPRPEQVRMAQLVAEALNAGGQLLVEAGTGTGKSLAYLMPAAVQAVRAGRRVVVSTATTTLQDQLFGQDLPLVKAGLGDLPLRVAVLKGRSNYLCLRRWQVLLHADDLQAAERMLLIKTLFWLPRTQTGDRAELRLSTAEEEAWNRLSAVTEACTPTRCAYHRIGVCFLARARRAAEDSHIVITNHALLLSDLASRSRVLPDYDVLIVDEAHHLEDEATAQLGWRLGERELLNRLERLWSPGTAPTGAVPEGLAQIASGHGLRTPDDLLPISQTGAQAVFELGAGIRLFFSGLLRLLEEAGTMADDAAVRLTGAVRAGSAWQQLEAVWSQAMQALQTVERSVAEISAELESMPGSPQQARDLAAEMHGALDYWRDVRRRMSVAVHTPDTSAVYWISGGGRFRSAWLNAAPLQVAGVLRDRLFAAPSGHTSVLVSATLAIGGSFDYVKKRLGLEDATAVALGSPFDYRRAALLYVPNDVPEPTQAGYQATLERAVLDLIVRLGGRTLVLFTSRAQLRMTYAALRAQLAQHDIALLGQGIDESSRTRLLEAFRRGARVALFGTNAFWEGIDVVGEALSCVVVTRLPFAVPTDPIYTARAEHFEEPFVQYAVPQAVLRLKQGFGRLIRSRSDRGAVVVLDRRLVTRFYGQVFLRSLPQCSVKQGPISRAGPTVQDWLERGQAPVAPG